MRLIDADLLIEEMRKWYFDTEKQKAAENDESPMDLFTNLAIRTVKKQPTVYDSEKAMKRLKEELKLADKEKERCIRENILQFDSAKGYANGIANAIEIVKVGGKEEYL